MFPVARNDYRVHSSAKNRGVALLVMLALILAAFTTIAISRLSLNSAEQKARARTTQSLIYSKDAIMAFALAPGNPNATPPGTLPCPDGDADGWADTLNASGRCPQQRGLVPFRTLNILQPVDGTGAPIWYVVANEYSRNLLLNEQRNSSSPTQLMLNNTLPMAFILLAPNKPILTQARVSPTAPLAGQSPQFLEGDNADNSTPDSYTNLRDDSVYDNVGDTHNDQVLGVPAGEFWSLVEGVVLKEVGDRLREYRASTATNCANYPWASPNDDNTGLASNFFGHLPLTNWNTACANAPAGWVNAHWNTLLFYAICRGGTNANPPLTPCLELDGDGDNNDAEAIIISPGVAFPGLGQTRPNPTQIPRVFPNLVNLFEGENSIPTTIIPSNNIFSKVKLINHSDTFNDTIYIVR